MSIRPRPLLAVRLIGPAEIVATQRAYLTAYLAEALRHEHAICRTSIRPGSYAGELRAYLTVTRRENH